MATKAHIHHQETHNTIHPKKQHVKRIHHNWLFWLGLVLMLIAIFYYVVSDDFTIQFSAPQK